MPKSNVSFLEVSPAGVYADITGLPNRTRQIVINSQDFSSDFYVRKKGTTKEKFISKDSEYFTQQFERSHISDEIFQIKGTGVFVIECTT